MSEPVSTDVPREEARRVSVRRATVVAWFLALLMVATSTLRAPDSGYPRTWTDPVTRSEFVLVDPDTFQMGTPLGERWREAQEVPHTVRLTVPYYLARYELTQSQWAGVMGSNPSYFKGCGGSCPVEQVTYHDVERFLARLNQRSRPGFRLPTEAEWEFACRSGGTEPFGHRSSLSSEDANIDGNYPYDAPRGVARHATVPVGSFEPNPWGLFDMSGNVWEWVQDWYCLYPDGPTTDPVGHCSSEFRVIRGGSWKFDGGSARCGVRFIHRPQDSGFSLGLRLAHNVF